MDLTQNELDQLRTAMNAELDRLIAARKPEVKQWPQTGDICFWISNIGNVVDTTFAEDSFDQRRLAIGNLFRTEAEAERRVEALKVQAELREMPGICYFGKYSYFIAQRSNGDFAVSFSPAFEQEAMCGCYFYTQEEAADALACIGQERLQIWLDDYLQTPIGGE